MWKLHESMASAIGSSAHPGRRQRHHLAELRAVVLAGTSSNSHDRTDVSTAASSHWHKRVLPFGCYGGSTCQGYWRGLTVCGVQCDCECSIIHNCETPGRVPGRSATQPSNGFQIGLSQSCDHMWIAMSLRGNVPMPNCTQVSSWSKLPGSSMHAHTL